MRLMYGCPPPPDLDVRFVDSAFLQLTDSPPAATTCPAHPQSGVWDHPLGRRCPLCGWFFDGREPPPPEPTELRSFALYRQLAERTDDGQPLEYHAGCLCEEAGELFGVTKKVVYHQHDFDRAKFLDELGDVLWYLDRCAHRVGVTLGEVAAANIAKLRARYPDGFSHERSRNRTEGT